MWNNWLLIGIGLYALLEVFLFITIKERWCLARMAVDAVTTIASNKVRLTAIVIGIVAAFVFVMSRTSLDSNNRDGQRKVVDSPIDRDHDRNAPRLREKALGLDGEPLDKDPAPMAHVGQPLGDPPNRREQLIVRPIDNPIESTPRRPAKPGEGRRPNAPARNVDVPAPKPPATKLPDVTTPQRPVAATLSGRVVSKGTPLEEVRITCDECQGSSNAQGDYEVLLFDSPTEDSFLMFAHSKHVTRFIRWDDLGLRAKKPVELESKRRTIVVDCVVSDGLTVPAAMQMRIRRTVEAQLAKCPDLDPLAEGLRDRIVKKLFENQESRALYDPKTLAKVGEFQGATHGVFLTASNAEKQTQ